MGLHSLKVRSQARTKQTTQRSHTRSVDRKDTLTTLAGYFEPTRTFRDRTQGTEPGVEEGKGLPLLTSPTTDAQGVVVH